MKIASLLLAIAILTGCSHKQADFAVIPPQQMSRVLWDIIQVDEYAAANLMHDSTKNLKNERMRLYQQVFDLHRISEKDFTGSFKYYSGKPEQMKALFDTLSARGERERKNIYTRKDSLRK